MLKPIALSIALAIYLTGCASTPPTQPSKVQESADQDMEFKQRLMQTSDSVERSLQELSEIQQAVRYKRRIELSRGEDKVTDPRLMQEVTVSKYAGNNVNIETFVERLAEEASFRYKRVGKRPAIPVIISVYEGRYRIVDLLQDSGMQAGQRATIYIKPGTIELFYPDSFDM